MDNPGDWDSPGRKAAVPFHMSVSPAASQTICLLLRSQFLLGREMFDIKTCCLAHLCQMFGLGNEQRWIFPSITGQTYGERERKPPPFQHKLCSHRTRARFGQPRALKAVQAPNSSCRCGFTWPEAWWQSKELSMHPQSFKLQLRGCPKSRALQDLTQMSPSAPRLLAWPCFAGPGSKLQGSDVCQATATQHPKESGWVKSSVGAGTALHITSGL